MFIIPAANPVAFNFLGLPIYKYGITMALAIFAAMMCANKIFNKVNYDKIFPRDIILEYAPLIIIIGILCARLYFCLLNPVYYFSHPLEILDIRQGGLSIHGGILGGILSVVYIAFKKKVSFFRIIDSLSCATFLGQAIGRWGNYFNSEAFGFPIDGQNWGLYIPESSRPLQYADFTLFHPTFLYESILDILGFFVLFWIISKFGEKYDGLTFFSYLVLYSLIRFGIEQIRVDSALNISSIPIAQIMSIILFIIGAIGIIFVLVKKSKLVS